MSRPSADQTLRVLVCENDATLRAAVCDLIESVPGLELVGHASDAVAAADAAAAFHPDVVVLDVRIPRGGGAQAARSIRASLPGARIIAFTAHADRGSVLDMLRAGVDEYLVKGMDDAQLIDAIQRTGRGHISLSAIELEELVIEMARLLAQAEARLEATAVLAGSRAE